MLAKSRRNRFAGDIDEADSINLTNIGVSAPTEFSFNNMFESLFSNAAGIIGAVKNPTTTKPKTYTPSGITTTASNFVTGSGITLPLMLAGGVAAFFLFRKKR